MIAPAVTGAEPPPKVWPVTSQVISCAGEAASVNSPFARSSVGADPPVSATPPS
ncbi:hypothetical protein OCH7691_04387 [Oceanibacterium hippocampi]|uniref:Uncharacterized protein n=1 Tax=Oceanibacterium hippocampi TaxID=745714 RepID=A0A1Y5U0D4_9PROT|nr:hypothetical protein OCH7691_04387 [Oceanibacterium hippocampi]